MQFESFPCWSFNPVLLAKSTMIISELPQLLETCTLVCNVGGENVFNGYTTFECQFATTQERTAADLSDQAIRSKQQAGDVYLANQLASLFHR
ncbi:hypothetical protein COCON_G00214050 [Conger conger]|uniref:Uncharacterized protein n=1 Tax=Conger conger TaxID=82655 RepID=A0A9Q1HP71_CONCO|nr:hypothetical protein COCON_G00214050 [Conger conger]